MQTFLPYPSFIKSAEVLDRQRLLKQILEVKQILNAISGDANRAWRNHPAVLMWAGHSYSLVHYGCVMADEWLRRGYKDHVYRPYFILVMEYTENTGHPKWLGDDRFHNSHQSNLVRKLPDHYLPLFPDVELGLDYFWPTKEGY